MRCEPSVLGSPLTSCSDVGECSLTLDHFFQDKEEKSTSEVSADVESKKNVLGDVTAIAAEKTTISDGTPTKTSVIEEKSLNSENNVTHLPDSAAVQSTV